ncbi:MAG: membrane protein insertase YidC [Firmicutes bacterium]|nr:membrane protein insertase YidC [Bacillota bacterium]
MGEIFNAIASFFSIIFSYIYAVVPNFGVTIILFTILVKLVIFPLNNQQIRSARRMQLLQPELKKIQQKHKDNKEKQNEEVMKFMQENKVNPFAGCVPLLIQFPILLGVFTMLKNIESFGITELAHFNPYIFPFLAGTSFDWGNLLLIDSFYILPALAGITTYLYSRLSMTDPNQKMFLYLMPAMLFYFALKLPSGLVLYWVINNFLSVGQHYYLNSRDKKEAEVVSK